MVLCLAWFLVELEFAIHGIFGLWGEGKTGVPGEKHLRAKKRTNNTLNPHMTSTPGFELGPHWWEASTITTAPSLASQNQKLLTVDEGGGGVSTSFYTRRLRPEVQPLTPLYTIFHEKSTRFVYLLLYIFYRIPCLELCILFNCCKCTVV